MLHCKEIKQFMATTPRFQEQPDSYGRRYYLIKDGTKVAYVWFKWALGGWNMIIYGSETRIYLDSLDTLKQVLNEKAPR